MTPIVRQEIFENYSCQSRRIIYGLEPKSFRCSRSGPSGPPKNKSNIQRAVAVTCYHLGGATGRPKLHVDFGAQGKYRVREMTRGSSPRCRLKSYLQAVTKIIYISGFCNKNYGALWMDIKIGLSLLKDICRVDFISIKHKIWTSRPAEPWLYDAFL